MDSCHLPPLFCSLRGRRLGPHEQPWKLHHRQPVTVNHLRPLHPQRAAHRPSLSPLWGSPSSTNRLVPGRPIPAAKLGHMLQLLGVWAREMPPPPFPLGTECRAPPEHLGEQQFPAPLYLLGKAFTVQEAFSLTLTLMPTTQAAQGRFCPFLTGEN